MLVLRKAKKEDCELLFEWANDIECRKNSFSEKKIDFEMHIKWLESKLKNISSDLFIVEEDGKPVGMLRLDYEQKSAIISYSVAKEERKKGYGKKILQLAERYVKKDKMDIKELIGKVKRDNLISMSKFEQLEYKKVEKINCVEYKKTL